MTEGQLSHSHDRAGCICTVSVSLCCLFLRPNSFPLYFVTTCSYKSLKIDRIRKKGGLGGQPSRDMSTFIMQQWEQNLYIIYYGFQFDIICYICRMTLHIVHDPRIMSQAHRRDEHQLTLRDFAMNKPHSCNLWIDSHSQPDHLTFLHWGSMKQQAYFTYYHWLLCINYGQTIDFDAYKGIPDIEHDLCNYSFAWSLPGTLSLPRLLPSDTWGSCRWCHAGGRGETTATKIGHCFQH